MRIIAVTVKW